jgi:hypothetical protein
MKKIIPGICALIILASCTHTISDSLSWQHNAVTADGHISEWSNPLRFYDDKSHLNYTISNDRENLYLCLKVSDEASQAKILHNGVEFGIDTLGKKSFPIVFRFPLENRVVTSKPGPGDNTQQVKTGDRAARASMAQRMLNHADEGELKGFKGGLNGVLKLPDSRSGISAAVNIDNQGILYYEAIIPFRTFFKSELSPADSGKAFSYSIRVKALPEAPARDRKNDDHGPSEGGTGPGGHPGGGGDMEGGGPGGHQGGMGPGGMQGGQRGPGGSSADNDLNTTNQIVKKLKFVYK